jgi:hypothetical protein
MDDPAYRHHHHRAPRVSASAGGDGLEVDKFDRGALDFQFDHALGPLLDRVPAHVGKTLSMVDRQLRGRAADLDRGDACRVPSLCRVRHRPFLPALAGRTVLSVARTDRFLSDYRRTMADLMARNYYGRMRERLHARGWLYWVEGMDRGHSMLCAAAWRTCP